MRERGELEEQLKLDIAQLLEKAKEADVLGAVDPAELPKEIARRNKLQGENGQGQGDA